MTPSRSCTRIPRDVNTARLTANRLRFARLPFFGHISSRHRWHLRGQNSNDVNLQMDFPRYRIEPLDGKTWPAFAALVDCNNGVFGGCWCMGFHPEGVGRNSTPTENRERKHERVKAGTAHAALVFDGDQCVGWCQFGPPEELPKIKSLGTYQRDATTPPDWRIGCCFVGKGHRRQGVAAAALTGALQLIASLGGGTVEGYPEDAASVPAGFLYNGALSTYENLGFIRDRMIGKHRWVMTTTVKPV
jgi:GNAT superfamily N-acetyltransferase